MGSRIWRIRFWAAELKVWGFGFRVNWVLLMLLRLFFFCCNLGIQHALIADGKRIPPSWHDAIPHGDPCHKPLTVPDGYLASIRPSCLENLALKHLDVTARSAQPHSRRRRGLARSYR